MERLTFRKRRVLLRRIKLIFICLVVMAPFLMWRIVSNTQSTGASEDDVPNSPRADADALAPSKVPSEREENQFRWERQPTPPKGEGNKQHGKRAGEDSQIPDSVEESSTPKPTPAPPRVDYVSIPRAKRNITTKDPAKEENDRRLAIGHQRLLDELDAYFKRKEASPSSFSGAAAPLVSIIVPVRGDANVHKLFLDNLLATEVPVHILLAHTDDLPAEVLHRFEANPDSRISSVRFERNGDAVSHQQFDTFLETLSWFGKGKSGGGPSQPSILNRERRFAGRQGAAGIPRLGSGPVEESKTNVPSMAELINFGFNALLQNQTLGSYVLLLSPSRVPATELFVEDMLQALLAVLPSSAANGPSGKSSQADTLMMMGCTTVQGRWTDIDDVTVVDKGYEVAETHAEGKALRPDVVLSRAKAGFSFTDARIHLIEPVLAVDQNCVLMPKEVMLLPTGPESASPNGLVVFPEMSIVDYALRGVLDSQVTGELCSYLEKHIRFLDKLLQAERQIETDEEAVQLSKLETRATRLMANGVELWERLTGVTWRHQKKRTDEDDTAGGGSGGADSLQSRWENFTKMVKETNSPPTKVKFAIEAVEKLVAGAFSIVSMKDKGVPTEEELGWDLSLRLRYWANYRAVENLRSLSASEPSPVAPEWDATIGATESTSEADSDRHLSSFVRNFDKTLKLVWSCNASAFYAARGTGIPRSQGTSGIRTLKPSMGFGTSFQKRWGKLLPKLIGTNSVSNHRAYRTGVAGDAVAPSLRVIWDAYCCMCCGFSNEIVHLAAPLMKYRSVSLTLDAKCYCEGFPTSVTESLKRMFLSPDNYALAIPKQREFTVWISHTDPMSFNNVIFKKRAPDYVIGRSMYEFTKIDPDWARAAVLYSDEIWVPAKWVKRVFQVSGVPSDKLVIVPEAIDVHFYDPAARGTIPLPPPMEKLIQKDWKLWCNRLITPEEAKSQKRRYTFLSDFKWEPRKGWEILLEAYVTAFSSEDQVSLYILTHIWFPGGPETYGDEHDTNELKRRIYEMLIARLGKVNLEKLPHFCLLCAHMKEQEMAELYNSVDAFVLPTRGEGWGLPAMQAMSMGLPTITTDWGGQMEFLTKENSFRIPVEAVEEIPEDSVYRWKLGKKWARPSLSATRSMMQLCARNPEYAKRVGEVARNHIVRHFSEEALAAIIDQRLELVSEKLRSGFISLRETPPLQPPSVDNNLAHPHALANRKAAFRNDPPKHE